MTLLQRLFGVKGSDASTDELEEWARHHDDPRSEQGFELFARALGNPDLTVEELTAMWQQANSLVGQRAPADYGEFLAYGYLEGRRDALTNAVEAPKSEQQVGTPRPRTRDPKSAGPAAPSSAHQLEGAPSE